MIRPAVDVVADELATLAQRITPSPYEPDPVIVRSAAADIVAALWDAGYAVTPQGARTDGSVL